MAERAKWRFDVRSSLLTLLVVGLGGLGYRLLKPHEPIPPSAKDRATADLDRIARLRVGVEGALSDPINGNVAVARTRDDYDAIEEAQDSGDAIGLREIIVSGRAFKVSNGNSAELKGKDPYGVVKLQLEGGDHAGEVGWASGEYFRASGGDAPAASRANPPGSAVPVDGDGAQPIGGP